MHPLKEKRKMLPPPQKKKVLASQLYFVYHVQTVVNRTTFETPSCESGLPKQGWRLGLQEMPPAGKDLKAQQDSPLPAALLAAYSLCRAFRR